MSQESIDNKRVRLSGGKDEQGDTELLGTPDLTIEVVSDSSEEKDLDWLLPKYWAAGICEYWVVDGRSLPLRFRSYRHGPNGFILTRKTSGRLCSEVLARSFRFVPGAKQLGFQTYRFEMR